LLLCCPAHLLSQTLILLGGGTGVLVGRVVVEIARAECLLFGEGDGIVGVRLVPSLRSGRQREDVGSVRLVLLRGSIGGTVIFALIPVRCLLVHQTSMSFSSLW